jgi:hypothetical protein
MRTPTKEAHMQTQTLETKAALGASLQLQLLLAAIAAFLPLAPAHAREKISVVIEAVSRILALGAAKASTPDATTRVLQTVRGEIERMAEEGPALTPDHLDEAMQKIEKAAAKLKS